jgi:hypothetical protein
MPVDQKKKSERKRITYSKQLRIASSFCVIREEKKLITHPKQLSIWHSVLQFEEEKKKKKSARVFILYSVS